MKDLDWLTEDVCRVTIRTKGSIKKAAFALGVSQAKIVKIIHPIKDSKHLHITDYGFDKRSKIVWPHPYPISELEKWIRDALVGQNIIVATSSWDTFSSKTKFFLSRVQKMGLVKLNKSHTRVEMSRTSVLYG